MTRRTLDVVFSVAGLVLAVLLLILGAVLQNQANFAHSYVKNQLYLQQITFNPVAKLSAAQRAQSCLVDNAGQLVISGSQAECYANEQIGLDVPNINNGLTFSQTNSAAIALKTQATAAQQAGAANAAALQAQYTAMAAKAATLFQGQTERGLLLTVYGFSIFGDRSHQAAVVCFLVALVLFLASIAGLVHAFWRRGEAMPQKPPRAEAYGLDI